MNKKYILAFFVIPVLVVAYWLISPLWRNIRLDEKLPIITNTDSQVVDYQNEQKILAQGILIPSAHEIAGQVFLIESNNKRYIRFENLKTTNGPDLFIYLATDQTAKDSVNLGSIRATEGNINYEVSSDTDTTKYDHVLIWCRAFRVLFSYAVMK